MLADFLQIAVARDLAPSVKILDQTYGDFDQPGHPGGGPLRRGAPQPLGRHRPSRSDVVTWVVVADGQAVNHKGQYLEGGSRLDVEEQLAAKWLERRVVMPAKPPAKKATKMQ